MRLIKNSIGFLTILFVVVSLAAADISLTARNHQYVSPNRNVQLDSSETKFEESKYGNAKYHQFEVHNVPLNGQNVRIEHINAPPGFPLDNPDLGATLLSAANDDRENEIVVKHENAGGRFPSNYQHDFPEKSSKNLAVHGASQLGSASAHGSRYLPPVNSQQYFQSSQGNSAQGSKYLPPPPPPAPAPSSPASLPVSGSQDLSQLQTHYDNTNSQNIPFESNQFLHSNDGTYTVEDINSNQQQHQYLAPHPTAYNEDQLSSINKPFRPSGYLPPSSVHSLDASQQNTFQPSTHFQRQEYVSPVVQQQLSQPQIPINDPGVKAPGFLPPGYDFKKPLNSEEAIAELHKLPEETNNRLNNNQHNHPSREVTLQSHIQVSDPQASSGIIYGTANQGQGHSQSGAHLPSGYDFQNPVYEENAGQQIQFGHQGTSHNHHASHHASHHSSLSSHPSHPSHPATSVQQHQQHQQHHSQAHVTHSQTYQIHSQNLAQQNLAQHNLVQQNLGASAYIPPTHNAALDSVSNPVDLPPAPHHPSHSAQLSQQYSQAQSQPLRNSGGFVPSSHQIHSHQQSAQLSHQPTTASGTQSLQSNYYEGPAYHSPSSSGSQVLSEPLSHSSHSSPPSSSHMHSLSSYMTNVQPFERYGSTRKPFSDYETASLGLEDDSVTTEVAPMYKEMSKRPKSYAPAMSYNENSVSSHPLSFLQRHHANHHRHIVNHLTAFSQHVLRTLQSLVPQEVRQSNTHNSHSSHGSHSSHSSHNSHNSHHHHHHRAEEDHNAGQGATRSSNSGSDVLSTPIKGSSKVRTVQIVNQNEEVKTLKVLESLDPAGIKTIKILGTSNKPPTGDHRVVKVVSGEEQTVQTVKIFNDHEGYDYSNPAEALRQRRDSKKSSRKGRQPIVASH